MRNRGFLASKRAIISSNSPPSPRHNGELLIPRVRSREVAT